MADTKISAFAQQTDLSLIDGLAGYEGAANKRISGSEIISSIQNTLVSSGLIALYDASNFDNVAKTWPDSSGNSFGIATTQPGATTDPILNTVGLGQP